MPGPSLPAQMAMALASRIDLVDQGKVVASDTTAALRANPGLIEQHMAL